MEIAISYKPNPLISSSTQLLKRSKSFGLVRFPAKYGLGATRKKQLFRVYASESSSGSSSNSDGGFSWVRLAQSIRLGAERIGEKIGESVKTEIGFDSEEASGRVNEYVARVKDSVHKGHHELTRFKNETVPSFIDWNKWEHWKDIRNWDGKRVAALFIYAFALLLSCQRVYVAIQAPRVERERRELTESFMEALIPEPSPGNIEK
jgi:cell division protease FtsH